MEGLSLIRIFRSYSIGRCDLMNEGDEDAARLWRTRRY